MARQLLFSHTAAVIYVIHPIVLLSLLLVRNIGRQVSLPTKKKFVDRLRTVAKLDQSFRTFSSAKEVVRVENARGISVPIPYGQIAGIFCLRGE